MNLGSPVERVTILDVLQARKRIATLTRRTPTWESPLSFSSGATGAQRALAPNAEPVVLKMESLQPTGSFKVRGAANKILSLSAEERARGVTTFSTGNHGLAVSYVARALGVRAIICISDRVPQVKVEAIKRLGGQIEVHGHSQDDAEARSATLQEEEGLTLVKPFDDPWVIAGQGTIGIELLEENPELQTVIVPLSGGGLISGVALALKSINPAIRVIGVSMERAPVMYHSLRAGRPVVMDEAETLADSLLGGIGRDNRYTFSMVREYVDETVLVPEEAIARAMALLLETHHMAVEGAAATGLAALLHGSVKPIGGPIATIVTGCNVNVAALLSATSPYLSG